jgi:hypothetical protein
LLVCGSTDCLFFWIFLIPLIGISTHACIASPTTRAKNSLVKGFVTPHLRQVRSPIKLTPSYALVSDFVEINPTSSSTKR